MIPARPRRRTQNRPSFLLSERGRLLQVHQNTFYWEHYPEDSGLPKTHNTDVGDTMCDEWILLLSAFQRATPRASGLHWTYTRALAECLSRTSRLLRWMAQHQWRNLDHEYGDLIYMEVLVMSCTACGVLTALGNVNDVCPLIRVEDRVDTLFGSDRAARQQPGPSNGYHSTAR